MLTRIAIVLALRWLWGYVLTNPEIHIILAAILIAVFAPRDAGLVQD